MKKILFNPVFIAVALLVIILFGISGYHYEIGYPVWSTMLLGIVIGILLLLLFQLFFSWLLPRLSRFPIGLCATLLSGFLALVVMHTFAFGWPSLLFCALVIFGLVGCLLLVLGLNKIIKKDNGKVGIGIILVSLAWFFLGIYGFNALEGDPYSNDEPPSAKEGLATLSGSGVEDPSSPGSFEIETFTYGSGTDKKRAEYGEGVKIKTPTVDASRLLPDWKGKKKKWREKFWGFGVKEFPLNGRVYMPKGEGPFPLVMIVHGNHSMIDYSDGGYAYLGELLASRGVIAVSVDENFINGHWSGDFMGKEMPTRAWLLLKHLELWKNWNEGIGTEALKGSVDMDNIVLVGHSRGGEAVSIAAAFNKLDRFPDNAQEEFDFDFGIKGIVTVAPTDYRYEREISLKDINYLSLQGAYDSDETSFWGMRPFHRLKFSDDFKGFKAGLYMNHANHGQFNSTWGESDFGAPMKWLLNLEPLVSGEEQRQVAKVYISSFVETVLKGNKDYLALFKNSDVANNWLPKEEYFSQYEDHTKNILLDFEEDLDVTSGLNGIQISTQHLKIWREQELKSRDGGSQQNNALVLGWKYNEPKSDSLPQYIINLPENLKDLSLMDTLALSLAYGNPSELEDGEDGDVEGEVPKTRFNFSVVLKDSLGNRASVDFANTNRLPKTIKSRFTKFAFLDEEMMGSESETQLKSCYLPISLFLKKNDGIRLDNLESIHFVFDKDSLGVIVLDDIGFYRKM